MNNLGVTQWSFIGQNPSWILMTLVMIVHYFQGCFILMKPFITHYETLALQNANLPINHL